MKDIYRFVNMTLDFLGILKILGLLLMMIIMLSIILVPFIAFMDLVTIKVIKEFIGEYKIADKRGRIIIIFAIVITLLKKILDWTR